MEQNTVRKIALVGMHNIPSYIGIGSCKQESNLRKRSMPVVTQRLDLKRFGSGFYCSFRRKAPHRESGPAANRAPGWRLTWLPQCPGRPTLRVLSWSCGAVPRFQWLQARRFRSHKREIETRRADPFVVVDARTRNVSSSKDWKVSFVRLMGV